MCESGFPLYGVDIILNGGKLQVIMALYKKALKFGVILTSALFFSLFSSHIASATVDYSQLDYASGFTSNGSSNDMSNPTYTYMGIIFDPTTSAEFNTALICHHDAGTNGTWRLKVYQRVDASNSLAGATLLGISDQEFNSFDLSAMGTCNPYGQINVIYTFPTSISYSAGEHYAFVLEGGTMTDGGFTWSYNSADTVAITGWYNSDKSSFYHNGGGARISLGINSSEPSCTDGIKNQDETNVDTGGVCYVPPPPPPNPADYVNSQLDHSGEHVQKYPAQVIGSFVANADMVNPDVSLYLWASYPSGNGSVVTFGPCYYFLSANYTEGSYPNGSFPTVKPSTPHTFHTTCTLVKGTQYNITLSGGNHPDDYYISMNADGTQPYYGLGKPSTVVCTVDCFSNVLFLPGLEASRLYGELVDCGGTGPVDPNLCGEKELWISSSDTYHQRMALDANGESLNNVYTKNDTQRLDSSENETGITDEIGTLNIYKSFLNDLRTWKEDEKIIEDYAFIPYDWRISLEDITTNGRVSGENLLYSDTYPVQDFSESFILKKLEELQASSRTGKVTLISHSTGGLVIKTLVKKLKDNNSPLYDKIDKIIFVSNPQVGTPEAMLTLLHGIKLGHGYVMSKEMSRYLAENMSTVYDLAPSAGYFDTVDTNLDPPVTFENDPLFATQISQYGTEITTPEELKNYVLGSDGRPKPSFGDVKNANIGNPNIYINSEIDHQMLDNWMPPPDTKIIQIAGWGEETVTGLDYVTKKKFLGGKNVSYTTRTVVDGDGTVVVPSALWMSDTNPDVERWWVNLAQYNGNDRFRTNHKDILEVPDLRDFIKSKIKNEGFIDLDNIVVNNISTLVSDSKRFHYTLHSPLTLGITSEGKYTGMDPITREIREEIPNVTYKQIGEVQFISVPTGIAYDLKLQGYDQGDFSLDIDKQEGNNIVESTSFQGIPSSTSTLATISITSSSNISDMVLKIDQNGDGIVDVNLNSKVGDVVTMPPYKFSEFLQPINDTKYHPSQNLSVFKAGSTIPVKFQLKNILDGTPTQAIVAPVWLSSQKGSKMSASIDESVYNLPANSGNEFRWDSASQQYIYNWGTKGLMPGYWYKIGVKLDDGSIYSVTVGLR